MYKLSPRPRPSTLSCTTKDIQQFILRAPKYMTAVDQFNEDEIVPPHLVFQFFRKIKACKSLKTFNLKWSRVPKEHPKPEIVSSVFKRHCQTIQKYDVLVLDPIVTFQYKNLGVPLKKVKTVSIDSSKNIRKLHASKKVENLRVDLRFEKTNYKLLGKVLRRLPYIKMVSVTCLPRFLNDILSTLNTFKSSRDNMLDFEILVGGQQEHSDIPPLGIELREKVTQISFQHISPNTLMSNLFKEKNFGFDSLKVLKLEFNNIGTRAISYFHRLQELIQLEKLTLILRECADKEAVEHVIKTLRVPSSLIEFELDMPLLLKTLLTHTKRFVQKKLPAKDTSYPWRSRNVFEEETGFSSLLETFGNMKYLKNLTMDFHMLETFNPHYTNFIVSILTRLPTLSSLEIQIHDNRVHGYRIPYHGFFDLVPFFKVCSRMPYIEQIEILMPNLLFDGVENSLGFSTPNLKSLTIGVDEREEDKPIKFTDISKSVEKILKTLVRTAPNLTNLTLDFAEVVNQDKLVKRFAIIRGFNHLEALGARFFVGACDPDTPREIGKVIMSLKNLNMLLLKFLETDKNIHGIENYIKYHKSLRNMMIQFNNTAWMDNDCLINPLKMHIKEGVIDVMGNNDEDFEEQNGLEMSLDEIVL